MQLYDTGIQIQQILYIQDMICCGNGTNNIICALVDVLYI